MSQNNQQRPTPETDAMSVRILHRELCDADFARKLERERDEAREQLEALRKTLIKSEAYQAGLVADIESMREAIKEALVELSTKDGYGCCVFAKAAIAKLQPFLKP